MRSVGRGSIIAIAVGLVIPGCGDDGQDDGAAGESTASTSAGEVTGTGGTGEGTADETGSGDAADTENVGPWTNLDERPCPDDSFLTYENFGGPFLLTYCTTCHASQLPADMRQGSPIEVNFDDIIDIRDWADRIWIRAADQNFSMPPVGPPPEDERALLGEWLACGAPTDAELGM